jgi:hypothetical protein
MHQRSEGKRRRRLRAAGVHIDREAVRAVLSSDAFEKIERLEAEFTEANEPQGFFWQMVREQMVRSARLRTNFAEMIMRAKTALPSLTF